MNERDVKMLAEAAREPDHRGWLAEAFGAVGYAYWLELSQERARFQWARAERLEARLAEIQALALRDL